MHKSAVSYLRVIVHGGGSKKGFRGEQAAQGLADAIAGIEAFCKTEKLNHDDDGRARSRTSYSSITRRNRPSVRTFS
jgi:hypothetical protein